MLQNIYIQRINRHTISLNLAIQDSATSSCPSAHSLSDQDMSLPMLLEQCTSSWRA